MSAVDSQRDVKAPGCGVTARKHRAVSTFGRQRARFSVAYSHFSRAHSGAEGPYDGSVDGGAGNMVTPGMYWSFAGKAVHWARCEDDCLMYITYDLPFDVTFR